MPLKGLKGLRFKQVSEPLTGTPWTRHFRHMEPIPRHWYGRIHPQLRVGMHAVAPKDRIKFWNIVPGDNIRLRGDSSSKIREVVKINKLDNSVYVNRKADEKRYPKFPYARCQLFLGNHTFPCAEETTEVPVFAYRVGKQNISWSRQLGRWNWDRVALATVPRLPKSREPRIIPWPVPKEKPRYIAGPYDTTKEALLEITYQLPPLPASLEDDLPGRPLEHDYIRSLFNPQAVPYDCSRPMELAVHRELCNPHSRAKKQARWQARDVQNKKLLDEYVQAELRALNGRTRREARIEAAFKWRMFLAEQARENKVKKNKSRYREARLERKRKRKARKMEKQVQRLKELALPEGRNQFVPEGVRVVPR